MEKIREDVVGFNAPRRFGKLTPPRHVLTERWLTLHSEDIDKSDLYSAPNILNSPSAEIFLPFRGSPVHIVSQNQADNSEI